MDKKNFQSALKQLEEIVKDLSEKDIDVETGLEKFKKGVVLVKFCREQLQKTENEFEKLKNELDIEEAGNTLEQEF